MGAVVCASCGRTADQAPADACTREPWHAAYFAEDESTAEVPPSPGMAWLADTAAALADEVARLRATVAEYEQAGAVRAVQGSDDAVRLLGALVLKHDGKVTLSRNLMHAALDVDPRATITSWIDSATGAVTLEVRGA